jgi:GNAT superfamily N-acetyltransferase
MTGSSELLQPPRKLEKSDVRSGFSSGANELDDSFRRFAWQNQRANNAVTYVLSHQGTILGYYAIASGGVGHGDVPDEFAKRRPDPIPIIILARLAVDQSVQSRGLGLVMFRDAIERAVGVSETMGTAAMVVHARDDQARGFYLRHAESLESPIDRLHLILPIAVAAEILQKP